MLDLISTAEQTTISSSAIRNDGGTQMRDGIDVQTVAEYAATMQAAGDWGPFPPVVVYHDGTDYYTGDGFHRLAAYEQEFGAGSIPADIRPGTRRDAILHAAGANADHGLRRTNADKRRAVETLLRDDEWAQWSDRHIAGICHVGNSFVSGIRRELLSVHGTQIDSRKVERNGTVYTQNTANIGQGSGNAPSAPAADGAGDGTVGAATCVDCGRPISDPESVKAGRGHVCAAKMANGSDYDGDAEEDEQENAQGWWSMKDEPGLNPDGDATVQIVLPLSVDLLKWIFENVPTVPDHLVDEFTETFENVYVEVTV